MKAVLLVAGLGTRLRPLTDTTPKCLLPVGGKPLLQIWLENLENSGCREVLINTHWLPEKVESFLDRYKRDAGLDIRTFHEPELLGSAGTLLANQLWFDTSSSFYIIYGDNLTWVDLNEMKDFHIRHGLPVTLGVFRAPHPERCGIAETDTNGVVTGFTEKPDMPTSNLAAAGIYIADKRIFDFFPDPSSHIGKILDLGYHIFPRMAGQMKYFEIDELIDIGTPEAYKLANQVSINKAR